MANLKFLILALILSPIIAFAQNKVDINTAFVEELKTLSGIGDVYAQRIIDSRPYSKIDDLLNVKGIGEKTLQKIKDQGLACVDCADKNNKTEQATTLQNIEQTNYPAGVYISEIMPNPKGADETDEWIKLFNSNSFEIDLTGWKIKDTAGTTKTFLMKDATKIKAYNSLVFRRPETKIMLNNDGDAIYLLYPNNQTADYVLFKNAPLGQTYIKNSSGWEWSGAIATKDGVLPKDKKSDKDNIDESATAGLSQADASQNIKNQNPWFLFFTALAISATSAGVVLFTKLKLNKNVRT